MPGFTVNEGLSYLAGLNFKGETQENLSLGLFTNAAGTLTQASAWADITQPTGTGYAEISLIQSTFAVAPDGVTTYPQQQWGATADWTGTVQGYYVRNNNASPVLVLVQYRDDGGFEMTTGRIYTVDLSVDTS